MKKVNHPSGLNRRLNDKQFIQQELEKAANYVRREKR